ncbi:MAG: PIN/TRAM domain-containing protein [Elusimicrobiota bacterium]
MFVYVARIIVIIAGPVIGYTKISSDGTGILIGTGAAILVIAAEIAIQKVKLDDIIAGLMGLILGLIGASLINNIFPVLIESPRVTEVFAKYRMLISVVFGYIGMILGIKKKEELDLLDKQVYLTGKKYKKNMKIIDTSAIIDARIKEISHTGFLEGVFVIPTFVMNEVQALADSADDEKRKKARRALDIVTDLRKNSDINIKIYQKDYPDIETVDGKLIKVTQELKGKLVTCDFNLYKAAKAQGVRALNINELANALKPKLLPGEAFKLFILKKGKDKGQGVGFLDDGTMVVVDGGVNYIGKKVEVTVSSVLQKPSGRMIFARVD